MANIVGVRFKNVGKVYYFDPDGLDLEMGQCVIVETARGVECGEVAMPLRTIEDGETPKPLKKVIRAANSDDLAQIERNRQREQQAFSICEAKIAAHKLDMKLVDVEYTFDNNKILFYFTADGRVDFRDLVKDLASVFRTRIELRQIGVRDEAKMLGGLGICGRPFCCSTFLGEFQPVSIKMAKEQMCIRDRLIGAAVVPHIHQKEQVVAADGRFDEPFSIPGRKTRAFAVHNKGVAVDAAILCPLYQMRVDLIG